MHRNNEIYRFIEKEILSKIKDMDNKELAGKLTRITKRLANMIMADGLLNALLFAYSKAKYKTIDEIIKEEDTSQIRLLDGEKVKEKKIWALMIWIVVKIFKKIGLLSNIDVKNLASYEPLNLLGEIRNVPTFAEKYLIKNLDVLAKFFDAYSR